MANNKRKPVQEESRQINKRSRHEASTPVLNATILQHLPVSTSTPRRAMPRQGHGPSPLVLARQYPMDSFNDSMSSIKWKKPQVDANRSKNVSKQAKITESYKSYTKSEGQKSLMIEKQAASTTSDTKVLKNKENIQAETNTKSCTTVTNKSNMSDNHDNNNIADSRTVNGRKRTQVGSNAPLIAADTSSVNINSQTFNSQIVASEKSSVLDRSDRRRSGRAMLSASTNAGPDPMPLTKQYPVFERINESKFSARSEGQKSLVMEDKTATTKRNQSKSSSILGAAKYNRKTPERKSGKSRKKSGSKESSGESSQESDMNGSSRTEKRKSPVNARKNAGNKSSSNASDSSRTVNRKSPVNASKNAGNRSSSNVKITAKSKAKGKPPTNKNMGPKKVRGEEENVIQEKIRKTKKTKQQLRESDEEVSQVHEKSKLSFSERMAVKKDAQRYTNLTLSERMLKQWKPLAKENISYISTIMESNIQETVYQCKEKHQENVQKFLNYYKNMFIGVLANKSLPRSACKDYEKLEQMIDDMEAMDEDLDERLRDVDKAIGRAERLNEEKEDRLRTLLGKDQDGSVLESEDEELDVTLEEDPLAKSINEKVYAMIGDIQSQT